MSSYTHTQEKQIKTILLILITLTLILKHCLLITSISSKKKTNKKFTWRYISPNHDLLSIKSRCLTNKTNEGAFLRNNMCNITNIHKYLRQFRYSYWWRARHMGVYKPLFMTSKKCWKLALVFIRQFLHSYWSRATARTVVPHHAISTTHSLIRSCLPQGGEGPYHFITDGVLCWKKSLNSYNFCIYFTFWPKVLIVFDRKGFMNGNQSVLNRFSTSGLNPPRPGSW